MKKLLAFLIICMATITNCSTKAQTLEKESTTFEEKPITFLQKQLIAKPTIEQLKKQIPKGYSLADETKKIITFEKIVGNNANVFITIEQPKLIRNIRV